MKALLAILLFFALAEPAAACRRFSIRTANRDREAAGPEQRPLVDRI